jgi:ATP-dependent DNA helicase RecG
VTHTELLSLLDTLLQLPHETEWVELKEANHGYDFRKLGKYFSALANEANLKRQPCGWLVFGVHDADRAIVGSMFRTDPADLDHLKSEIAEHTTAGLTFLDIHVLSHPSGRVVLFQVPPAPAGIPIAWQGHFYGRDGEALGALALNEIEGIRSQSQLDDWSAAECPNATLDDLDPAAVAAARANFQAKNQDKAFAHEMSSWSDATFLDRAKITSGGGVTRAALLLLGKPEATHLFQPFVAEVTWRLEGEEQAYEHFGPPFLLNVSKLYARIRNTNQKVDIPSSLVPLEFPKYEKWVVLEALHNAIAHQDYTRQARVVVAETVDRLTFESAGRFFEGTVSDYTLGHHTPQRYRNKFLANAMVNVNMIDTMGYGIQRMFQQQRQRFYPLPDFDLSRPDRVVVTIHGKVIDPNYTALLMDRQDLPLKTVILLDRVQKRLPIDRPDANSLRRNRLIEGRYPNLFVAAHIASVTGDRVQYIRNRAFDDEHYKQLITKYLEQYGEASRQEIDGLIMNKLSDVLSEQQKHNKVRNLLQAMARGRRIRNAASRRQPRWMLVTSKNDET